MNSQSATSMGSPNLLRSVHNGHQQIQQQQQQQQPVITSLHKTAISHLITQVSAGGGGGGGISTSTSFVESMSPNLMNQGITSHSPPLRSHSRGVSDVTGGGGGGDVVTNDSSIQEQNNEDEEEQQRHQLEMEELEQERETRISRTILALDLEMGSSGKK